MFSGLKEELAQLSMNEKYKNKSPIQPIGKNTFPGKTNICKRTVCKMPK